MRLTVGITVDVERMRVRVLMRMHWIHCCCCCCCCCCGVDSGHRRWWNALHRPRRGRRRDGRTRSDADVQAAGHTEMGDAMVRRGERVRWRVVVVVDVTLGRINRIQSHRSRLDDDFSLHGRYHGRVHVRYVDGAELRRCGAFQPRVGWWRTRIDGWC